MRCKDRFRKEVLFRMKDDILRARQQFNEEDAVHIYLGGYHNHTKQILLEKIYTDNKSCEYFHQGDLDVYGFLILENLKEKTGIQFAGFKT